MELYESLEVDVEESVSAEQEEVFGEVELEECSCSAEGLCFDEVGDVDAELTAIAEVVLNDVSEVSDDECDVSESLSLEAFDLVLEYGFAGDGYHGFGHVASHGGYACAFSSGHDDGFHSGATYWRICWRVRSCCGS